jgi:hypothetical protein
MKKNKNGFWQGRYFIENINKFDGKNKSIIYKSSWESKFCYFLDHHPNVKKWCYECLRIKYYNCLDQKNHVYITDFCFQKITNGNKQNFVVEVKPKRQIFPPLIPKNKSQKRKKRYLQESQTYVQNLCKWAAADEYCKKKDLNFRIVALVKIKEEYHWEVFTYDQIKQRV